MCDQQIDLFSTVLLSNTGYLMTNDVNLIIVSTRNGIHLSNSTVLTKVEFGVITCTLGHQAVRV